MLSKPLSQITLADLTALVGQVREGKTLEFKRELAPGRDGDIQLLAGVSALANTSGGDFIIGMEADDDGIATRARGVDERVDAYKLRLEQLLASQIEPRLPSLDIHPVATEDGRHLFIVRAVGSNPRFIGTGPARGRIATKGAVA